MTESKDNQSVEKESRPIQIMHTSAQPSLSTLMFTQCKKTPIILKSRSEQKSKSKKQRLLASKKSRCVQNDESTLPSGYLLSYLSNLGVCHSSLVPRPSSYHVQRTIVQSAIMIISRISVLLAASLVIVLGCVGAF
jgi:hypothetical protein